MNGLPRDYDMERIKLGKDLEARPLNIIDLRLKSLQGLRVFKKKMNDKWEENCEESAMTAYERNKYKKQFKGRFNLFGEYGHKAANCKSRKDPSNYQWVK